MPPGVEHAPAQLTGVCKLCSPGTGYFQWHVTVWCRNKVRMLKMYQNFRSLKLQNRVLTWLLETACVRWLQCPQPPCIPRWCVYVLFESCGNVDLGLVKCNSNWIRRNHLSLMSLMVEWLWFLDLRYPLPRVNWRPRDCLTAIWIL